MSVCPSQVFSGSDSSVRVYTRGSGWTEMPASSREARALPNPFNKLRGEILTRILLFVAELEAEIVPQETIPGRPLSLAPANSPSRLGRVCRAWREMTLGIPALSTIFVSRLDPGQTNAGFQKTTLEPLLVCLRRSRDLPRSIFLIRRVPIPQTLEVEEREQLHQLLSVLYPYFHRIETLVIETNLSSSLPDAVHLLTTSTAVLGQVKHLVLASNHDDSILLPPYGHSSPFFPNSHGSDLSTRSYNTLTALSVDGRNIFPMLHYDVFSSLTRLETLNINHLTYRVDGYSHDKVEKLFEVVTTINLPHLRTLGFHNFEIPPPGPVGVGVGVGVGVVVGGRGPGLRLSQLRPLVAFSIDRLVIKETNRASMEYILGCVTNPRELCLIGCFFNVPVALQSYRAEPQSTSQSGQVAVPSTFRLPNCEHLTVVKFMEEDEDLARVLSHWQGRTLKILSRK